MKKLFTLIMILPLALYAQDKQAMRKIESARIALITERLGLSPEQAQKFWPLYNEFSNQKREIRNQLTDARKGIDPNNITEEQSQRLMELQFEVKQKELNLEKAYATRLREVITSQQLLSLRKAEDDFKRLLLQRLEQRRRQQENRDRIQQRQDLLRNQGNN